MDSRKQIATAFLDLSFQAHAHGPVAKFCSPGCKHHNPYFAAGMDVLADAMEQNGRENPERSKDVKHVMEDNGVVEVHSHVRLKPGDLELSTVHLFRFEGD